MQRFPTWTIIIATAVVLYGGLIIAAHLVPDGGTHKSLSMLPSPGRFLAIGIPVYVMEAVFFIVGPIELAAGFLRMPPVGAAAGILGYGVVYHWSHGLPGIIMASWMALVLCASYLVLRARSKKTAILSTVGQKVAFLLFAGLSVYMLRPDQTLTRDHTSRTSTAWQRTGSPSAPAPMASASGSTD